MANRGGALDGQDYVRDIHREVVSFLAPDLRWALREAGHDVLKVLEEIRLRAGKPLMLQGGGRDWLVESSGKLTTAKLAGGREYYIVRREDINKTLELMSENSIYAYQDEIRSGYITLKGGHRVGVAGRTVLDGSGIKNIKDISGMNIRISREVRGCADRIIKSVVKGPDEVHNTLVISPPQCGKTTMLRDLSRLLSNGVESLGFKGVKVGIVDERSELAACYKGIPQNDVGVRTDVLDGCPKAAGMEMLLRSMSPQVIVTDEIGNSGDSEAVMHVMNAGISIIASAHGYGVSDMKSRREVLKLMEASVFQRYIVLGNAGGPGTVCEIVDGSSMKAVGKYAV